MLSPPEADLVRRDRALPGLATVLDPEALLAALTPAFDTGGVRAAAVRYVRYKPHTNCLAAYRFEVDASPPRVVHVHAKAHRPDAPEKLDKARRRAHVPVQLGSGRIVLEDRALVVWAFPNDPHLPAVRRLADPSARPTLLRHLLPERRDLWGGAVEPLRYKPERRFVGRLDTPDGPQAVLKVHGEQRYTRAVNSAASIRSNGSLVVPRLLGRANRHRVVALEWQPGRPLAGALHDDGASPDALAAVGAALGALHVQRSAVVPPVAPGDEMPGLLALARDIAFLSPSLAARALDLAGRLVARLRARDAAPRTIHGDFYADQVLLTDDGVVIFDLDRASLGDPAADFGTFAAHLEREVLRVHLRPGRALALQEALLDGYREFTKRPTPAGVDLYTAVALFRLVPEPFRALEPDWPGRMAALVERAAAAAAAA
jgi:tRNA A-37 threonylcarbamoyl transferase component Bud32